MALGGVILHCLTSIRRVFGPSIFFNPQLWGWLQGVAGVLHPSYYDHKSSLGGYYKCRWVRCKSAIYTWQRSLVRFVEFFWLSCGGGTPTSDNFQKSKEKNWENRFLRSDAVGNPEIHVRGASLAVIWISVRISRLRWKLPLLCTLKVYLFPKEGQYRYMKNSTWILSQRHSLVLPANLKKKIQILTPSLACCHLRPSEITPFEGQNMHENSGQTRFITPRDRCNWLTPLHYLHEGAPR